MLCGKADRRSVMFDALDQWIYDISGGGIFRSILSAFIYLAITFALALLLYTVVSCFAKHAHKKARTETFRKISGFVIKRKIHSKAFAFGFFFFLSTFSAKFGTLADPVGKVAVFGLVVTVMLSVGSAIDVASDFYATKSIARKRPLKGPLQILKTLVFFVFSIVMLAVLIGQSPIVLISGIGTFTAILSIVFKDALLGLVAGIQITSENLLQIGDWVSIPSTGVEGTVTDIALISVKVTAFDNTVITVPAYTFLSTPFKNWHTTIANATRQASYVVSVDPASVKEDNDTTNLTSYRNALLEKIKSGDHTVKDKSIVCRCGNFDRAQGLPVEVFFSTDITDYAEYCHFVSEHKEKAIVSLGEYGLKPYGGSIS